MPTITVEGPVVEDVDRKRNLAKRLTDVAVEVYGIPHVTVLIKENRPENVAADGVLIADMHRKGR
jgi:4-oxalocrotonate tautomerase